MVDWLGTWKYRIPITIDAGDIDADLANFPVLLYISADSGISSDDITAIFDELGANSLKIAVTTDDGTTQCYVEVDEWDNANEKAWLWVKVPAIDDTNNTTLYLYFDSTQPDNTDYVGAIESTPAMNVWDSNFLAVYHLRDKTTSSVADSTSKNYDGTKKGANEPIVVDNGKISDCQDFDGTNDYISCGDVNIGTGARTFECLCKSDAINTTKAMVGKDTGGTTTEAGMIYHANAVIYWRVRNSSTGEAQRTFATSLDTTNWFYLVGTYYPTTELNAYLNGVLNNGALTGTIPSSVNDNSIQLQIGARGNNNLPFNGKIDEVRISTVARSASWIKATYQTEIDDLVEWGIIEEYPTVGLKSSSNIIILMRGMDLI